jgi:ATP-dependent DNA helicase RecG
VDTAWDLLWHLPRAHEDLSKIVPLRSLREGPSQSAIAVVGRISERRTSRGTPLTDMELLDESGAPSRIRATWFGRQFVKQRVREGQRIRLAGKLKWFGRGLVFDNPDFEPADSEGIHTGRIVPIYRLTEGLSEKQLRRWLHTAVEGATDRTGKTAAASLVELVPDPLPPAIRERQALPRTDEALRQIHFPDDPLALFRARRRLAFDELLTLQMATAQRRQRWIAEARAMPLRAEGGALESWISALPFALTGPQRRATAEIARDLGRAVPMSRLLEGDVGSGKTVVAALAMRIAVAGGAQAALMAPTELLAEQHFRTLASLYAGGGPRVELLTSSVTGERRARIAVELSAGDLPLVVGTHALVEEEVGFARLALAVVDEQHRFGVRQRSLLREKGIYPHVLLTTATPIPQTLWQTLNRDLDVSVLDELPAGRREIRTEVRTPDALPKIWAWLKERVALGEQAFIVCPRIDPGDPEGPVAEGGERLFEARDAPWSPSAVAMAEELGRGALYGVGVALVHGRMAQRERDSVMTRFRDREVDVLVATTVVEVGIDVPNATVMVVLGAERFGLSQLHQLRGRIGRGTQRSFCVLVSPETDSDRLRAMTERVTKDGRERALNGFELAQRDLEIRGPGQFLGAEQSGFADQLRVVDLTDMDPRLLEDVSAEVDRIMAADPELERIEHAGLRDAVDDLWRRYGQV